MKPTEVKPKCDNVFQDIRKYFSPVGSKKPGKPSNTSSKEKKKTHVILDSDEEDPLPTSSKRQRIVDSDSGKLIPTGHSPDFCTYFYTLLKKKLQCPVYELYDTVATKFTLPYAFFHLIFLLIKQSTVAIVAT